MIHLLFYTPKHFFLYGTLYVHFTVLIKQDYIFETMTKATGNVFLLLCCIHTGTTQPDSCSLLYPWGSHHLLPLLLQHCLAGEDYQCLPLVQVWTMASTQSMTFVWCIRHCRHTAMCFPKTYENIWNLKKKKRDCTTIQNRNWSKLTKVQMSTKDNKRKTSIYPMWLYLNCI